ncbi:MAG: FkbM family methyltransferase [Sedimenticola sp.]|nr:FkbM family methyltransferase [Sedimenticola sp.]
MKQTIKKITPAWAIKRLRKYRLRHLVDEINALPIEQMGVDEKSFPWVKLREGRIFYGLPTSNDEQKLFGCIKRDISSIDERCFGVISEIIDRYRAPRSLPGELTRFPSRYAPIRDPLNDYDFSTNVTKKIASKFNLRQGDVVVDIGAFHGFGTMRMADYIGENGKIVAFEANPVSLDLLKRNIVENRLANVIVVPKAASNYTKEASKFYYDGVPTGNSLRGDVLENLGINSIVEIKVDVDTPDNVLSQIGIDKVNHVSITVNGGEPEALEGMANTIKASDNLRITMPGWYYRDGERLDVILERKLVQMGLSNVIKGKLGRVLAWK